MSASTALPLAPCDNLANSAATQGLRASPRARIETDLITIASYKDVKKVVLAYSGGLDTSVILGWLQDEGYECHAVYVDLGQPCEDPQATLEKVREAGLAQELEQFGVQFVTDTCWCMIVEPVVPSSVNVIMTNSAKYAHYGPGLLGKRMRFGSLASCVEAACSGTATNILPSWLRDPS